ncbi:MAG: hypothetical protein R3343_13590 [Nitriliruptorales bacterium]|nr:hypothetical protein [Nitriliruptorales bacterium]
MASNRPKTSTTLRWIHFAFGLAISGYFFLMPDGGWSDTVNSVYTFGVISVVFWTGVIRWQLPRIRRWRAQRARAAGPSAGG